MEATWVLYTTYRFSWSEMANGLALALVGITAVFVQGFLIRQAVKRLGERRMVLLGLAVSAVSFLCYGLAYKGWMMLVVIVFACLGGMAGPAIQGLIAGNVKATEQGRVQGALTSISSLTAIAAPLLFTTWLFGYFTSERAPFQLPGAPFFLGSLLFLAALVIMAQLFAKSPDAGNNTSAPGPVIKEILEAPGVSAG
jgi:DHA1 family tetracycline resistance protein-like MFS transporter